MNRESANVFRDALEESLRDFALDPLSPHQLDLLARHYSMLCKWNAKINLTRIIAPREAARLHYAESLLGGKFFGDAQSILDIGSGAGFPAVPLAVLRPDLRITALEINQKKALFLNEVKDALGLETFFIQRVRVEELPRADFDLLTARAVDRAETIIPEIIRSLSHGQRLMLYCGADLAENLSTKNDTLIHKIPLSKSRVIALFSA
jgi:16S rRNA (guanine527-N7)-methyltransferase